MAAEIKSRPKVYAFETGFVCYWRDKQRHEVDFVVERERSAAVIAIECKAKAAKLDPSGLAEGFAQG